MIGDSKPILHEYSFSELVDSYDLKSVVSIGNVNQAPIDYHFMKSFHRISVDENGDCGETLTGDFVPELDTKARIVLSPETEYKARHLIGPSGIISVLFAADPRQNQVS